MTDGPVTPERIVSTGHLPDRDRVAALVAEAWQRFHAERSGTPSTVYPALAAVYPSLFGICVADVTLMIPYTAIVLVAWLLFFVAWYLLGIPIGPGYPAHI